MHAAQQFALDRIPRVQTQPRELVGHRQRECRDVVGVGRIGTVLRRQVQDARAAQVGEQRRISIGEQALEEHTLAQTRLGDFQAVEPTREQRALHHDRASEDQIGACGLDARNGAALRCGKRRQTLHELLEGLIGDDRRLHSIRGQAASALHRGGQVAHGAADADQARAGVRQPLRARQLGRDVFTQLLDLSPFRGPVRGQKPLGHAHRAQPPGAELARGSIEHAYQLQRSTAEIQYAPVVQRRRVDRGQIAIASLLLAAQDANRQARMFARLRQEVGGILGIADRARRERIHGVAAESRRAAEVIEHIQRGERAAHRLLPQPARRGEALADTHRLVDLVGSPPPALPGHEHDEPERVRAQVDHRQPLARCRHDSRTPVMRSAYSLRRKAPGA
jgi:hypothetical protein